MVVVVVMLRALGYILVLACSAPLWGVRARLGLVSLGFLPAAAAAAVASVVGIFACETTLLSESKVFHLAAGGVRADLGGRLVRVGKAVPIVGLGSVGLYVVRSVWLHAVYCVTATRTQPCCCCAACCCVHIAIDWQGRFPRVDSELASTVVIPSVTTKPAFGRWSLMDSLAEGVLN
jgi:hypothetical protein